MKTLYKLLAGLGSGVAATAMAGAPLLVLPEDHCVSIADSGVPVRLQMNWTPFLEQTRICPLRNQANDEATVFLVSVFARAYFEQHPDVKDEPEFPRPQLIDRNGRCLGQLPELFPFDPPRDLTVRYGVWKANVPTEIRIRVVNPAVGGDYELPRLRWDAGARIYRSANPTDSSTTRSIRCPT